ncbi:MAG: exodeoxyribonuclease VII small subunit [Acidibacillus sp.]|uniref:Exodeoxyribonuclease 7 small subunit n=1 Tax=Sulfoacidibacillus ferrooxidans TaxID=2005001 RepID=A0A9X1V8K4_9BACL|nr:exodeoxyribonuclease VII small subunit [Sulfoacidibacillus ferrooxidans]MCI0183137.1 Exodeoxyribonuclease 7 small subunit [Sulfoacidibacillus ferrooxidans]MCY0893154.1 exodeoxyribonuclease VII small subunit [Acidibacillus sp.]
MTKLQSDDHIEEELSFEVAIGKLEETVRALEAGELSLDDAIAKFQLGMQLVRICRDRLQVAEHKVEKVLATEQGIEINPFAVDTRGMDVND